MPTSNHDPVAALELLLQARTEDVATTLQATCAAVRKAAPEACEHVFENYSIGALFTFTGKMGGSFCHCIAYENHVNLGFNRGTELDDPKGLLAGTGKLIRHVRIESPATLKKRDVQLLIRQAVVQGQAMAEQRGGEVPPVVSTPASRAADPHGDKTKAATKKTAKK